MSKRKNPFAWLGAPYYLWAAVFIIIPLLLVVWYGLTDSTGAFTFENVAAILNPAHSKALLLSILLSLAATGVCLLLAYPLCMILTSLQKKANSFIVLILILPMWMNFLLRTYAWQSLLEKAGIINSLLSSLGLPAQHLINTPGAIVFGMALTKAPRRTMFWALIVPSFSAVSAALMTVTSGTTFFISSMASCGYSAAPVRTGIG